MQGLFLHLVLFLLLPLVANSQQILWAKLYPLPKDDQIACIAKDEEGNMYAGGRTERNLTVSAEGHSIIYKLSPEGDTIFSKLLGVYGTVRNIVVDPDGIIRLAITQYGTNLNEFKTHMLRMTPDGFIFKRDTINQYLYINGGMLAKDSSWILVGQTPSMITGGWWDMFFQRIRKDGTIESYVSMNPGHPQCGASRVEQLPNGKYLVSGYVGSRVASYTLNFDGSNPVYEQWYQSPAFTNVYSGHVGQALNKNFMIGAEGSPSILGLYDSLKNKLWLKKDTGVQVPPQAMTDGSILFGYTQKPNYPNHVFSRFNADSSVVWYLNLIDSLSARGLYGNMKLSAFVFFGDQSAVVTGTLQRSTVVPYTAEDPLFIKIANVGTPVTSLFKPKKGSLANETLAPWPNPSSGTLYLKQHFNKAEIRLYNLAGKEMNQYQLRFAQPIDISGFPTGVYLYRAVIDGKGYSGKIVKQ